MGLSEALQLILYRMQGKFKLINVTGSIKSNKSYKSVKKIINGYEPKGDNIT